MTVPRRFKVPSAISASVAVLASRDDLVRAAKLRRPPDAFELRLDALHGLVSPDDARIRELAAPLIITARHPREGGFGHLREPMRRDLLLRYLPLASYVDVELRSAEAMSTVWESAKARGLRRIISVHAIKHAPPVEKLRASLAAAGGFGPDIFKIAVRTDTVAQLERLIQFFEGEKHRLPISAMGIGLLGRRSRIELARRGSALNYAHLGSATAEGQLSLRDLHRVMGPQVAPSSRRA